MNKKIISGLAAAALVLAGAGTPLSNDAGLRFDLPVFADDIVKVGSLGSNISYTLDSGGLLVIYGDGAMTNSYSNKSPWYGNKDITRVIIKDGVTRICDNAFQLCYNIESISIPDSVTSIGNNAFEGCAKLKSITIPEGVTSIGKSLFAGCKELKSVTIPDGVTSIGGGAFSHCTNITDITIPDGVTSIGPGAFRGMEALKSIAIPDGVKAIECGTFADCKELTEVTVPDSITIIDDEAFYGCASLKSITIPEGVTKIGEKAFYGCETLSEIAIPYKVEDLGFEAFRGCKNLSAINIDKDNRDFASVDGVVYNKEMTILEICPPNKKSVHIPEGVRVIMCGSFRGCSELTEVTFPESVYWIYFHAFRECPSLKNLTIPSTVETIQFQAFGYYLDENIEMQKYPGITITGYTNTAAEEYAKENSIKFIPLDGPAYYNKYPVVKYEVKGRQFRIKWTTVPDAEKYGLAVYQNGKWRVKARFDANVSSYTSYKLKSGTYRMVLCAKVNGEWDTSKISSRAFSVTIP